MGNFDIFIIQIYLIILIVNILKNKTIIQIYRFLKLLVFIMFVFAFYLGVISGQDILVIILKLVALTIIVGIALEKEIILTITKLLNRNSDRNPEDEIIIEVVKSIDFMSQKNIGALITFEKSASLEDYVTKAYPVNARLTNELLSTMFVPEGPLHDGGVIIRGDEILCAGAYYPPTERLDIPKQLGSRHRAAIGVSEISDSLTIVVSEQTGNISVAVGGRLDLDIDQDTLIEFLENHHKI